MVLVRDGDVVLGDNEDAGTNHPLCGDPSAATIWVFPPGSDLGGRFGCSWIGWPYGDRVSGQAGMNGAGLALGLTAVPPVKMTPHPEHPYSTAVHGGLYYRVLLNCETVEDALKTCRSYDLEELPYQILVADRSGDAAVISPGKDGELHVLRRPSETPFLVASTLNAASGQAIGPRDARRRMRDATRVFMTDLSLIHI